MAHSDSSTATQRERSDNWRPKASRLAKRFSPRRKSGKVYSAKPEQKKEQAGPVIVVLPHREPEEHIADHITRLLACIARRHRHQWLIDRGWRFMGYSEENRRSYYANLNLVNAAETFDQISALTITLNALVIKRGEVTYEDYRFFERKDGELKTEPWHVFQRCRCADPLKDEDLR